MDTKPNILLTGAAGQLGCELSFLAPQFPEFNLLATTRETIDLNRPETIDSFFARHSIQYCINCAAYTAVDRAESESELAEQINAHGVRKLALACKEADIPLIHFSTDYVYHNRQNKPFKEEDPTSPQSVYAITKKKGEEAALTAQPLSMIIRTSWVYSSFGHNFVKTMLRLGRERSSLNVVFDQIGTPTYARDLALAVFQILRKIHQQEIEREQMAGIFHYSNEGVTSWYDFAKAIFEITRTDCNVQPIETSAYPTPAPRPPFSVLNKQKIKSTFGIQIPYWRNSLKTCLALLHPDQ